MRWSSSLARAGTTIDASAAPRPPRRGLVLRGSVRLVAAATTRLQTVRGLTLAPADLSAWRFLRGALEQRRGARTQRRRFRRDPTAYLAELEAKLTQLTLPA